MTTRIRSLTYVGAGGNIGSHAIEALARLPHLDRITLIDPDVYEERNLRSQAIARGDVGKRKVDVLEQRVQRINPKLQVETFAMPVEQVPLGRLRADVIATGLDGLAARRSVSRSAWRLGRPWVDAGVRAEGLLARVDVYMPDADAACLECAWGADEHDALDRRYPCDDDAVPAATNAPAYLGAAASSLQSSVCASLLCGDSEHALIGRQVLTDIAVHRHYVSRHTRSPACPFDHHCWSIVPIARRAGEVTLAQALSLLPDARRSETRLRVPGDAFVHRLVCPRCNASHEVLRLARRLPSAVRHCQRCDVRMVAPGIDTSDTLSIADCTARDRRSSLFALGLRRGDVFSIEGPASEAHFEIGG